MTEQKAIKEYVQVHVDFSEDGHMRLVIIRLDDGRKFRIDRVSDVKQAAAMRCGGQGDRYTIWLGGQQSYLYFERNSSLTGDNIGRWFVERKVA